MDKNDWDKTEISLLNVIMATISEGQSWKIRAVPLEWCSGVNPSGFQRNNFIKLLRLFI